MVRAYFCEYTKLDYSVAYNISTKTPCFLCYNYNVRATTLHSMMDNRLTAQFKVQYNGRKLSLQKLLAKLKIYNSF